MFCNVSFNTTGKGGTCSGKINVAATEDLPVCSTKYAFSIRTNICETVTKPTLYQLCLVITFM